jgi:metal-responsive CopG/Arc/MetJ family transcriptional regulator
MARESITFRIDGDLLDEIDEEAEEEGVSRSEYIRQILRNRHQSDVLGEEVDTLEERLEAREERIETLEQQLARRSELEERIRDLPDKLRDVEAEPAPPWPIRWVRWFRRNRDDR